MIFKLKSERKGEHIHCRLFAGETTSSLALCGELVFYIGEWQLFGVAMTAGARATNGHLTFLSEDERQVLRSADDERETGEERR